MLRESNYILVLMQDDAFNKWRLWKTIMYRNYSHVYYSRMLKKFWTACGKDCERVSGEKPAASYLKEKIREWKRIVVYKMISCMSRSRGSLGCVSWKMLFHFRECLADIFYTRLQTPESHLRANLSSSVQYMSGPART